MAKKKGHTAAAGVAGAMIGAAVVAGAVILKDDKTRKKIEGAISDVKDQTTDYIDKQRNSPEVKKQVKEVQNKINDLKDKADEISEEISGE